MIDIDGKVFEVKEIKSRENIMNPEVAKFVARTSNRPHNPDYYAKRHAELYEILTKHFDNIKTIGEYEYEIPSLGLIIEDRLDRYNNYNLYRPGNGIQQRLLNSLIENNEVDFIKRWCIIDYEKSMRMDKENVNFLEIYSFFNEEDVLMQIDRKVNGIKIIYDRKKMLAELNNLKKKPGDFSASCLYNKITSTYNGHFYEQEQKLYNKSYHRRWVIENLMKYLVRNYEWAGETGKVTNGISTAEILRQFRISRICDGFSQHSPLWVKAFIQKYNIKSIYDFTGGWGHRLLGCWDIDYIYNDIDERTVSGCRSIWLDFGDNNTKKVFYNEDSSCFTPKEDYECVFSCPPYYTTEIYQHDKTSTSTHPSYDEWLNGWWFNTIKSSLKPCVKYFAFIVSNEYREDMKNVCLNPLFNLEFVEEIGVNKKTAINHFHRNPSKDEGGKSDKRVKNIKKGEKIVVFKRRELQ